MSHTSPVTEEPAEIAFVRELVNTVEWQEDDESWSTVSDLAAWLAQHGHESTALGPSELVLARRVREGVRELLLGHAGHRTRGTAIDDLNDALRAVPVVMAFTAAGEAELRTAQGHPLASLVAAIGAASGNPAWERLKACSRDSCRWAYWDASRNASGRWCSMQGCGNFVKMSRRNGSRPATPARIPLAGEAARPVTLVDVAGRAGVSIKTVSNVVNGAEHVSPRTRERVQRVIDELDYRPNLAARALATGRASAD
jgi:predicted RNA-binding Zn ribbon-like protein